MLHHGEIFYTNTKHQKRDRLTDICGKIYKKGFNIFIYFASLTEK